LGFTGGLKLSGGLIHLKARVYSAALRRFLQPDTVDLRRYTYSHGDPMNYVDPDGREEKDDPPKSCENCGPGGSEGGKDPGEEIVVTGKRPYHDQLGANDTQRASQTGSSSRERAESIISRIKRDLIRGTHNTPPFLRLAKNPRPLSTDERRLIERALKAQGLDGAIDFMNIIIVSIEGLDKAIGNNAAVSPYDPNAVLFEATFEGSSNYGQALVHEMTHVYIFQVVFEQDTQAYMTAFNLYYHTPDHSQSPGYYSGIYNSIPWEATAFHVEDFCSGGRGDKCEISQ